MRPHGRQGAGADQRSSSARSIAARLAADVLGVPTVLVARTDAAGATLLTSDVDPRDRPFITGERTPEGFFRVRGGLGGGHRPRAWPTRPTPTCSGARPRKPDLDEARRFAEAIHAQFPGKLLAYNCSPSFNWKRHLDDATIATLPARAGRHGLQVPVHHPGRLPRAQRRHVRAGDGATRRRHDAPTCGCRSGSSPWRQHGYTATKHQREVGTGYFDQVAQVISAGQASTLALKGSTEEEQFHG